MRIYTDLMLIKEEDYKVLGWSLVEPNSVVRGSRVKRCANYSS